MVEDHCHHGYGADAIQTDDVMVLRRPGGSGYAGLLAGAREASLLRRQRLYPSRYSHSEHARLRCQVAPIAARYRRIFTATFRRCRACQQWSPAPALGVACLEKVLLMGRSVQLIETSR